MKDSYDYIVVGSGPAGAVLANKLSEKYSVLLLEAGENHDTDELIKSSKTNLLGHMPEYFWMGECVPQKEIGLAFHLTGGRLLGGGSSINGEMYIRPSAYVLKQWEKAGGSQWSPDNAYRNYMELEDYDGNAGKVHGKGGDLKVRQTYKNASKVAEKFVAAIEKATGYKRIEDYNDISTPNGPFFSWQLYQKPDGERASSSVCFLNEKVVTPEGKGVNRDLTILYRSTAVRVIFDGKKAVGIEHITDGASNRSFASKKVIISAGINSAKLLMLSGIGPEDVLKKAGVKVIHNNPNVGKNYADDMNISVTFEVNVDDAAELRREKSWNPTEATSEIKTDDASKAKMSDPHSSFVFGAFLPNPIDQKGGRSVEVIPYMTGKDRLTISLLCVDPKSRGYTRIQSSDPLKIALVDYNYLSEEIDMVFLKAVLRQYMAEIGKEINKIDPKYRLVSPSPDVLADDQKLEKYIRSVFGRGVHDQCNLSMGSEKDGAVDGYGNVYGVEDLIVADASIIPYHMDGNTSASVYLIGYTVAKHLLGEE